MHIAEHAVYLVPLVVVLALARVRDRYAPDDPVFSGQPWTVTDLLVPLVVAVATSYAGRVPVLRDVQEFVRDASLRLLDLLDRLPELHPRDAAGVISEIGCEAVIVGAGDGAPPDDATLRTRTAADLRSGCFDTGSHARIVSVPAVTMIASEPGNTVARWPLSSQCTTYGGEPSSEWTSVINPRCSR